MTNETTNKSENKSFFLESVGITAVIMIGYLLYRSNPTFRKYVNWAFVVIIALGVYARLTTDSRTANEVYSEQYWKEVKEARKARETRALEQNYYYYR